MSHFVVAVITKSPDEVENILQTYHEFECTGTNDQYVQNIDITDEVEDIDGLSDHGLEDKIIADESEAQTEGEKPEHKWGYAVVKDGKLVKAVRRTNPSKKWDWWQVGRRYEGLILTKQGKEVNQALKSDIDFDKMREDAEDKAAKEYDAAHLVIDGRPIPHWDHFREVLFPGKIDEARKAYHDDPVSVDWKKAFPNNFFGPDASDFDTPRVDYINAAGNSALSAFAVLDSTGWHERGEMGWWGMVTDEKDQASWSKQLREFFASVPDDHYITMVDCHI